MVENSSHGSGAEKADETVSWSSRPLGAPVPTHRTSVAVRSQSKPVIT